MLYITQAKSTEGEEHTNMLSENERETSIGQQTREREREREEENCKNIVLL